MLSPTNELLLLAPDIPEEYMLDTDDIDSIYISQRYLLLMLAQLRNGGNAQIVMYDTPELQELLTLYLGQWIITDAEFTIIRENMLLVPSEHYTPTWYITWRVYNWGEYIKSKGEYLEYETQAVSREVTALLENLGRFSGDIRIKGYKVTSAMHHVRNLIQQINPGKSVIISDVEDALLAKRLWWKSFLHNGYFTEDEKKSYWIPSGEFIWHSEWQVGLIQAIDKLRGKWIYKFACKPVFAASGEWILLLWNEEAINSFISEYAFPFWDIILEELIELSPLSKVIAELWDDPLSLSVQFQNGKLMGQPTIQITHNWEFQGNIRISKKTTEEKGLDNLISSIYSTSDHMIKRLWLTWSGGFDYLVNTSGTPYFIDPNLWRDTWALPLRTFDKIFWREDQDIMFVKLPAHGIKSLNAFKDVLHEVWVPLFSTKTNIGVAPMTFVSERHLSAVIISDNINVLWNWYEKVKNKLLEAKGTDTSIWRLIATTQWKVLYTTLHWKL